jgi:signal transduction histidine kinase
MTACVVLGATDPSSSTFRSLAVCPDTNKLLELSNAVGRVQHEMNNPLAALLAEAQLLELDTTLNEEQRQSIKRIVDLARRVIASSRKLDSLREVEA